MPKEALLRLGGVFQGYFSFGELGNENLNNKEVLEEDDQEDKTICAGCCLGPWSAPRRF